MEEVPSDDELTLSAVAAALREALRRVEAADSGAELAALAPDLTGKRSRLSRLKSALGGVIDPTQRAELGQAINSALAEVSRVLVAGREAVEAREMAERLSRERVDVSERLLLRQSERRRGRTHLVTQATERLEDVFVGLGFRIAEGPEVESDYYNFEALNMPVSHPARSMWDTLFVDSGEPGSVVMRTHTSPVQIRVMESVEPPIYMVMPGRVFRRDTPDATHMPVFHQIEGLVIDRDITFADLAGTIESFTKAFFGAEFTSRLRPSYFPFTEPSAEFDIRRPDGKWLELGGCGMVHPRVLRAGGIDPEEWSGFAFGFGIDRMAKERHEVADLRDLYGNDVRFVEQFP
jgi:phenylalanyl-tRNA synthetase alpha chain